MCGITGFWDRGNTRTAGEQQKIIGDMQDAIRHRGPDDAGFWLDTERGLALGFRRLAIIDLSPTGRQPMTSADGRYTIIFNGEVYNFQQLRDDLLKRGYAFRGTSDTEVMLSCMMEWGIAGALQHFNGMFAFVVWDHLRNELTLARDRLGIKPLYYGWIGDVFLFGSELKPFWRHPVFSPQVERDVLGLYFQHSYVPAPYSIFRGIRKLSPGNFLTLRDGEKDCEEQEYWSVREASKNGLKHPFKGLEQEAVEQLDNLLRASIAERMIADVPLGAFLSGGIDSSTIVALMQAQSSLPVRTFTIGFLEDEFNETRYAREAADYLGTRHSELILTPEETWSVIPQLPDLYDEPFADCSQIPTHLVARMARQQVTVSLSGDGGDELFGGYTRYTAGDRLWMRLGWIPAAGRRVVSKGMGLISPARWENLLGGMLEKDGFIGGQSLLQEKIQKLQVSLDSRTPGEFYLNLVSHWKKEEGLVLNDGSSLSLLGLPSAQAVMPSFAEQMMFFDQVSYLPGDILTKVDRASMGCSLEARAPFLDDHRVLEFAWRLPMNFKIRGGKGKWILRQVLQKYLPPALVERPKMGFAVPIGKWLRGDLREWAEDLLDGSLIRRQGYLNPEPVLRRWQEHLSGRRNWQYYLWDVLMFQSWMSRYFS